MKHHGEWNKCLPVFISKVHKLQGGRIRFIIIGIIILEIIGNQINKTTS